MKNNENADKPISAMEYVPPDPLRRSGRPAQVVLSAAIRDSSGFTAPEDQGLGVTARRNQHRQWEDSKNAHGCCIMHSVNRGSEGQHHRDATQSRLEPLVWGLISRRR